jgi:hypothetical protein
MLWSLVNDGVRSCGQSSVRFTGRIAGLAWLKCEDIAASAMPEPVLPDTYISRLILMEMRHGARTQHE